MIKTAIILAGGLGTRLRSAVADVPKCMAPVNGIPFISFVIAYLQKEGIENFIFSLGYKSEIITAYADENYKGLHKKYVIETKQLGTGGAIKEACKVAEEENVIVVNGDTLFTASIQNLAQFHETNVADCTLALKEMANFDRYGAVELDENSVVNAFKEKQFYTKGSINGGIYALNVQSLLKGNYPEVFSFEKEFLEKNVGSKKLYGVVNDAYFIDIGIPEDYQRFQDEYNAAETSINASNNIVAVEAFLNGLTT